jgi:hydrogenase maturation protease
MAEKVKKTVIIGLGNPLLTDDAIGLMAIDELESQLPPDLQSIPLKKNYSGGFDLLYEMVGFDRAIIIDSICTEQVEPGFCMEFSLQDIEKVTQPRLVDSHGLNLPTVMAAGRKCGYAMPDEVLIFGIEGTNFTDFCEKPTDPVLNSLPEVTKKVLNQLEKWAQANLVSAN